MSGVRVNLGRRSYDFLAGRGILARAGWIIRSRFKGRELFVVTSAPIRKRYGASLRRALRASGARVHWLGVPDGERAKTWTTAGKLLGRLARRGAGRDALVVAFGGGTVGDLAGFAAATYARGIALIQIPTTLLAQVDSSVGGKTGVDLPEGKNLAGAFHQPSLVIADLGLLRSLSPRQLRSGLAEVVKHGAISSPRFFSWLERNAERLAAGDERALANAVLECVRIKAAVVSADEREAGRRAILNFGHTAGHALEAAGKFRGLAHGEAVAIGMVCAARLSASLRLCGPKTSDRIEALLRRLGLPVRPPGYPRRVLIRALAVDKKRRGRGLRLVLMRGIGKTVVRSGIDAAAVVDALYGQKDAER